MCARMHEREKTYNACSVGGKKRRMLVIRCSCTQSFGETRRTADYAGKGNREEVVSRRKSRILVYRLRRHSEKEGIWIRMEFTKRSADDFQRSDRKKY